MLGSFKTKILTALGAAIVIATLAPSAFAQSYTITTGSGNYATPPTSATQIMLGDDDTKPVDMPFGFLYYGTSFTRVNVGSNGFCMFGESSGSPWNLVNLLDGMVAACWDDMHPNVGGRVEHWTTGTAPNRVFRVSFTGVPHYNNQGSYYFQMHFYETSGRIVFAYDQTQGTWTSASFNVGIDGPNGDSRRDMASNSTLTSRPVDDYIFDPRNTTFTGTVLLDQLVVDGSGIGNSQLADQPAAFVRIELNGPKGLAATVYTNASGVYSMQGLALDGSLSGTVSVVAGSLAGKVLQSDGGAAVTSDIQSGVSYANDVNLGTHTIDDGNDSGGSIRAAVQAGMALGTVYDWVSSRTTSAIPPIDFVYDANSGNNTAYTPAQGMDAAKAIIGSPQSGNDDATDPAVLAQLFAHHAIASMTGFTPTQPHVSGLDKATSVENAFAEGFGAYLYSVVSNTSTWFEGVNGSTSVAVDLETPAFTVGKSPSAAAWVAAALWDLVDAENESHDGVDGTAGTDKEIPFDLIDAMLFEPTPARFLADWTANGGSGPALVRDFIFHGVFADDIYELNDSIAETAKLGEIGVRVNDLVLQPYNDDVFEVSVGQDIDGLLAGMSFNRFAENASVTFQILDEAGTVLATGAANGASAPFEASTGPLAAGNYLVRAQHDAGPVVTDYTLQIFAPIKASAPNTPAWTAGRPINQQITVEGGIPPFTMSVKPPNILPSGLTINSVDLTLGGVINNIGNISFALTIEDDGAPIHSAQLGRSFVINPALEFAAPDLTGVPINKQTTISLGRTGGTPPFLVSDLQGTIPSGLTVDTDTFEIIGTATVAGGEKLTMEASDVAGSTANLDTSIVVCLPFEGKSTNALLKTGDSSAGFYFDALEATTANISIKTLKRQEKRTLNMILIGPDGGAVDAGVLKLKNGKATLKKVTLPDTGRYYAALASEQGGETTLVGKLKKKQPTTFKGKEENIGLETVIEFSFPAIEGATFDFRGRLSGGVGVRVEYLRAPDGTLVAGASLDITESGKSIRVRGDLDQSGTWTVRISPKAGKRGNLKYTMKVKNPKGVEFSAD